MPKHAGKVVGVFKLKEKFKKLKKAVDNTIYIRYTEYRSDEHKIIKHTCYAIVVQLVVRHLAKVEVAGSSPVCRSELTICNVFFCVDQLWGCGFVTVQKGD